MKEFTFTVTIELSDSITGNDDEVKEMANNIATGLVRQANNEGLAPEGDAFTSSIKVEPQFLNEEVYIRL